MKSAIKRVYKDNKGIYGAPSIHSILCKEGFNVFQRKMNELSLYSITVKKYSSYSNKKVTEDLEKVL